MLIMEVSDNGPGLPAGRENLASDPLSGGDRPAGRAWALGLTICHAIMKVHGGTIAAVRAPEGGAVIRMTFPLSDVQPEVQHG